MSTRRFPSAGGRHLTAADRGLEPSNDTFAEGQRVRLAGEAGPRYHVLGFRPDGTADIFEQAPGTGHFTVDATRLRRAKS